MRRISGNTIGIIMMVLSTACFTINDTLLKLAMADLPPFETLFIRGTGSLVLGIPVLATLGYLRFVPKMFDVRVQARNLFELTAAMGFVVGLAYVPIADLTALGQTSPLLLLLGVAFFFRERLQRMQIALIVLAFIGAILVAQPGARGFSPFTLFGLWSAAAVAARDLIGRKIKLEIPGIVVAVGAGLIEIIGAGIAGLFFEHWVMPSPTAILLGFGASAFLITAHWLLLGAYRVASVGAIAPFLYSSTIWALLSGWLIFRTVPNAVALSGIALILLSGTAVVALERWPRRIVVSQ
ncbi:MAG TPA: DMT family transporter [Devosiaceae bacterium]|jgi:drug/metabolite transporter (DMT)-like permease